MLTDAEIHEKAAEHIARFGGDLRLSRPVTLKEPEGIFYKVERATVAARSTNLVSPFVVLREDGRIVTISAGDVMPGVVNKLYGWAAMRADPELQKAVIDPNFEVPRHVEVWSAIIKELMRSKKESGAL
jgi:hypothetical protein